MRSAGVGRARHLLRRLTLAEIAEQSLLMIFKEASECLRLIKKSHFAMDNGQEYPGSL